MSYTPPPLDLSYEANGTIYTNSDLENTVYKFSNIFLDHLIPGNLLPQDILERIIEDPDSLEDIFTGKFSSQSRYDFSAGNTDVQGFNSIHIQKFPEFYSKLLKHFKPIML